MIKIVLKDGLVREYQDAISIKEVAENISSRLARVALVGKVNDKICDLDYKLEEDCSLSILTFNDEEGKNAFRHTSSHILAQAVKKLYPDAKLAIGPAIENGFYYDFDIEGTFSSEDLEKIEKEMEKIVKEDLKIERFELSRLEALKLMNDEPYKVELIYDLPEEETLSFYKQGDFVDLCAGPHLKCTGKVKAFKLISVAGAYWRGSEKNKMLQRIYGTSFEKRSELEEYINNLEEAKKRDHRKLGKELDLYSVDEYIGQGLILWHPKLSVVREEIELYWRKEHRKRGYEYIYTPHLGLSNLWETSGHLDHFADGMYPQMSMANKDETEKTIYYVKPMSCPFHVRIFKSRPRSYRELPLRWCELGNVYRFEKSGALHGMMRVRGFSQDDAHIICREDQFVEEVNKTLDFALAINHTFGYDNLNVYLSVRDLDIKEKYIDNEQIWQLAERTLEQILIDRNISFKKDIGGAKFYGPAVDLKAVDCMGREWQGTTIQLDMNLPERFGMTYVGTDGKEHTPIMLHRTLLGSMERFVGTLIEHYGGAFPTWLAPIQAKILPISYKNNGYAQKIREILFENDIRVEVDDRAEKIGYKVRVAQLEKIPYMLIVGEKEEEDGTVAVRNRVGGDQGVKRIDEFMKDILEEIKEKRI
jgi:threonyl-tRNA synthetase